METGPAAVDRQYLDVLFDHFPTAVLVADDGAYYVDANQAACAMLRRTRNQIIGQHLSAIVAPGRQAEVDLQWQSFIRDGSQQGVFEVVDGDGSARQVQFHAKANFVRGLHCSFLSEVPQRKPVTGSGVDVLTVCAWSKRVRYEGEWVPLEQYLMLAHTLFVSHGISPEAFAEAAKGSGEA
jgi:PAS domain S-box-containing protein